MLQWHAQRICLVSINHGIIYHSVFPASIPPDEFSITNQAKSQQMAQQLQREIYIPPLSAFLRQSILGCLET